MGKISSKSTVQLVKKTSSNLLPFTGNLNRFCPILLLTLLLSVLLPSLLGITVAKADPNYDGPLYYALDPILSITDDPRLLGVDRLVMMHRLHELGVDPVNGPSTKPDMEAKFRQIWLTNARVDLKRESTILEYSGTFRTRTAIKYPKFLVMFPAKETLPGGFPYYPPRPLGDPAVSLFVDDATTGAMRTHRVQQVLMLGPYLDVAGKGKSGSTNEGLLNLTIPIKLPRTLEKIIGRGEKTRIKISGRERIKIAGESSIIDPFVPSERVASQSYFPSLDMEQELKINLSGNIGEKILIEVDHNSAAIGPEATKIKLMYQGLEDEIIRTIETGDVGLTLPNSGLLGYSSNKSGLFGIKVTGQVGRADFTLVASKQKAESSDKTFNSQGGVAQEHTILSSDFQRNRFFYLDLPSDENARNGSQEIDITSIKVFVEMGIGIAGTDDISDVAVYENQSATWFTDDELILLEPHTSSVRWREVDYEVMVDQNQDFVAIDLKREFDDTAKLGVRYSVTGSAGAASYEVGDKAPSRGSILGGTGDYYRLKLLKDSVPNDYTTKYSLKNIYSLGARDINVDGFALRIERKQQETSGAALDVDESGVTYMSLFGLDIEDANGSPGADGIADNEPYIIDRQAGLIKFVEPFPFAADTTFYSDNAKLAGYPDFSFSDPENFLLNNRPTALYTAPESEIEASALFRIIANHSSGASSFDLGVSNIEEGSEVVKLNGRTLTKDVDYEIDYTFGQVNLKGDAANLTADSKVSITYQYAPFFGGGKTSLMGFNLGLDLGRESQLSTTWLYQTSSIVGEKAKLGEEPSRNLVGNINLNHKFHPYLFTHIANFLSLHNSEKESTLQFRGEVAVNVPNGNTKGKVYVEDFEGVDSSDILSLARTSWFWPSLPSHQIRSDEPVDPVAGRELFYLNRADKISWYLPVNRVLRRYLNPSLTGQERDETQQSLTLFMRNEGGWGPENWGGIMRGVSRSGLDLTKSQFFEFWINDSKSLDNRRGRLHIDFGHIDEDGYWGPKKGVDPDEPGVAKLDTLDAVSKEPDQEDQDGNSELYAETEDTGLDGDSSYGPIYDGKVVEGGKPPFPKINYTQGNNRLDTEDINASGVFDQKNSFYRITVDLKETEALVDVHRDYSDESLEPSQQWRKYRIKMSDAVPVSEGADPLINRVTHVRIWYERTDGILGDTDDAEIVELELSDLKFLGSRWTRDGIRRNSDEVIVPNGVRVPGEEFFLSESNNKENPDLNNPFHINETNGIEDKEQALVLEMKDIEPGHHVRVSKQVSAKGDDYTNYETLSWYWRSPTPETTDMEMFFRIGSDTTNYYEIDYRFSDSNYKTVWKAMSLDLAELSNAKNETIDAVAGHIIAHVPSNTFEDYRVHVVGSPDLRRITRFYFGARNDRNSSPVTGTMYINDVKLEGIKKDLGFATSAGASIDMAEVIQADFTWSKRDANFHGLNADRGSGVTNESWTATTNFDVDDFIPLAGFKLPIRLSREQTVSRPKYETNSDIEILDKDVRNQMSNISTSERFTSRFSHSPSKNPIMRYLVDPWVFMFNGSRSSKTGPTRVENAKTLVGSVSYDLRIPGTYRLGRYPLFEYLPIVKGFSPLPKHIAFSANFNSSNRNVTREIGGESIEDRPIRGRSGVVTGSLDFQPLSVVDVNFGARSERDLLRENIVSGVNVGHENVRSYDVGMIFTVPRPGELPKAKIFMPVRKLFDGLRSLGPSITFSGSFVDNHHPNVRLEGDPYGVSQISNNGNWDFRAKIPIGKVFKDLFSENKRSERDKQILIEKQRARDRREGNRGNRNDQTSTESSGGGSEEESTDLMDHVDESGETIVGADKEAGPENLTPEEIQRREDERLLAEAEAQLERDREAGLIDDEEPEELASDGFSIPNPLTPVLNILKNTSPVSMSFFDRRTSGYTRSKSPAAFWYMAGLTSEADIDEEDFIAYSYTEKNGMDFSTSAQLASKMSLDVKFDKEWSTSKKTGQPTRDYKQVWPDASVSLSGIEKWGVFGRKKGEPDTGWFQSSNINLSYKRTKNVSRMTADSYDPRVSVTMNPRWNFTFHSGFTATLTSSFSKDVNRNNGIDLVSKKISFGLQMQHKVRAQNLLIKLGLYRPGSNPTINMNLDVNYSRNVTERGNPDGTFQAPSGNSRFSIDPRFTYQITSSLSGSLNLKFMKQNNLGTGQSTTIIGLGLEATFVF